MSRILRPQRLLYLYIIVTFTAFGWLMFNYSMCPDSSDIELKDTEIKMYKQKLKYLESLKGRLKEMELRLEKTRDLLENSQNDMSELPMIYAITPTYTRIEQKAELVRLRNTLLHVKRFHWIIIEDSEQKTGLVARFLASSGLKYTHLNVLTPAQVKLQNKDPRWRFPRGVLQRNAGLRWIRENVNPVTQGGVLYFADDDNTYDLHLFEEMRYTQKVSVWPVGIVGNLRFERPIVIDGKVKAWFTYWKPDRPFAMDMAGFAINIQLLFDHPNTWFTNSVQRGYQESSILQGLNISLTDLEPRADNCSKVLVWHTRHEKIRLKNEEKMMKQFGKGSDPDIEV